MSEEEIIKEVKNHIRELNGDTYKIQTEYNKGKVLQGLLDLYNKQKEEIEQKDIMNEALKNAIGNILQGQKLCKEIKGGKTIHINLIEERDKYWQDKIKERLKKLKEKEQELSDEQGYFGSSELQAKIEELEELLGE